MDYLKFIDQNCPSKVFLSIEDCQHVAQLLEALDKHFKEGVPLYDDFLEAIAKRNFYEALKLSDETNKAALFIYGCFMYSHAPAPEFIKTEPN